MKRFKNILLICDFDTKQHLAVERAASLARQNEARLTVITVVKEIPSETGVAITAVTPQELFELVIKDRQEKVDTLVADMGRQGLDAKSLVVTGTPFLEIIRQVLRDKHDLVILSAEDKGGIKKRLFGSTSMHLMRKCPCPVWVVKQAQTRPYARILAAVDPTTSGTESDSLNPLILQLAGSMANKETGELHVIHVWHLFGERYLLRIRGMTEDEIQKARERERLRHRKYLNTLLEQVDVTELKPHLHLIEGDPVERIPELVVEQGIDLLVMGTVCRTGIGGFLIGNTAEEVLNQIDCSVLTVKPEGFVTPVTLEDK
ncbi:MAG: universal stress protein, UspA [Gammaproteobacteria bacterium]|nr:universal stress protein, UspA [Gammaproteobacteria bacterium]